MPRAVDVVSVYHASENCCDEKLPMRAWLTTIVILPVALIVSTVVLTVSHALWHDVPLATWQYAAVELSLAAGTVWLVTRQHWPQWHWRGVIQACGEGWLLLAIAGAVAMGFGMLAPHVGRTWDVWVPALLVAAPLAWWCMAEEIVLRVMLPHVTPASRGWGAVLLWVQAVALMWLMSTPTSWYAVVVIAAGELLGVVTARASTDFATRWGRRWAWRWLMAAVCGATQLGVVLALPSAITLVVTEALVPAMVTAGVLVAWSLASLIHLPNAPTSP